MIPKYTLVTTMQLGIDSFAAAYTESSLASSPSDRIRELLEQIELADEAGLDVFGIGEHHRREYLDSAPASFLPRRRREHAVFV